MAKMARPWPGQSGPRLNKSALAAELGLSRQRIAELSRMGIIRTGPDGLVDKAEAAARYAAYRHEVDKRYGRGSARARLDEVRAEEVALRTQLLRAQYVTRPSVEMALGEILDRIEAEVSMISGRVAPRLVGLDDIVSIREVIALEVYEVLERLSTGQAPPEQAQEARQEAGADD